MASEKEMSISDTAVATCNQRSSPTPGIERSDTTLSSGSYPKLSNLMGSWPDVAIFRRFGSLNTQNLLFLQAELSHMERALQNMREREEKDENIKGIMAQRSWWQLDEASDEGATEQGELIHAIQAKLKEYNEFLLQYKQICALQNPSKHDLKSLIEWLERSEHGDNFLEGVERDIFHSHDRLDPDQERASDLVTLSQDAAESDFFSRWLKDEFLTKFHKAIGYRIKRAYDVETGAYHYRKAHFRAISHLFGVLLASAIPAASIFTLYFVTNMIDRLGVILVYSTLFSISLAIFTSARRVEIFAATAAYVTLLSILVTVGFD